jgi:hypothetical protein
MARGRLEFNLITRRLDKASFASLEKFEEMGARSSRAKLMFASSRVGLIFQIPSPKKNRPIAALEVFNLARFKLTTPQADQIQPMRFATLSCHYVRRYIGCHHGIRSYHTIGTDSAKLVNSNATPDESLFTNANVPRYHRVVGKNDPVLQYTVMGHMRVRHQEAIFPDNCLGTSYTCTVYRHRLTYNRSIADLDMAHRIWIEAQGLSWP